MPPSGLEKQRQWAAGGQVRRGPAREQLWCVVKGELKLVLCKLKHRERKQQAVNGEELWSPAFIYNCSS